MRRTHPVRVDYYFQTYATGKKIGLRSMPLWLFSLNPRLCFWHNVKRKALGTGSLACKQAYNEYMLNTFLVTEVPGLIHYKVLLYCSKLQEIFLTVVPHWRRGYRVYNGKFTYILTKSLVVVKTWRTVMVRQIILAQWTLSKRKVVQQQLQLRHRPTLQ